MGIWRRRRSCWRKRPFGVPGPAVATGGSRRRTGPASANSWWMPWSGLSSARAPRGWLRAGGRPGNGLGGRRGHPRGEHGRVRESGTASFLRRSCVLRNTWPGGKKIRRAPSGPTCGRQAGPWRNDGRPAPFCSMALGWGRLSGRLWFGESQGRPTKRRRSETKGAKDWGQAWHKTSKSVLERIQGASLVSWNTRPACRKRRCTTTLGGSVSSCPSTGRRQHLRSLFRPRRRRRRSSAASKSASRSCCSTWVRK